jgi:hypothetical protein
MRSQGPCVYETSTLVADKQGSHTMLEKSLYERSDKDVSRIATSYAAVSGEASTKLEGPHSHATRGLSIAYSLRCHYDHLLHSYSILSILRYF